MNIYKKASLTSTAYDDVDRSFLCGHWLCHISYHTVDKTKGFINQRTE